MWCTGKSCYEIVCWTIGQCLHFFKGLSLLLPFLCHECLLFLVIISACVGLTAIISFFHEICWYRQLPADIQAVSALVFLTAIGEGSTLALRDSCIKACFKRFRTKFPWIFQAAPLIFWFLTFDLALYFLYHGYKDAHPAYYFGNIQANIGAEELDPETLNARSTFFVLLSLSVLTYGVPKWTDWMSYRFHMNPADLYVPIGCKLYFAYYLFQILLLLIYALPLLILAFACYYMDLSPGFAFSVLILNALGIGLNVAQLEGRYLKRCPRMHPPNYAYENHLAARANLFQYLLIPLVTLTYYGTGQVHTLPPDIQFLLYTLTISLAVLQATKCIFNNHYLSPFRQLRRFLGNNQVAEFLEHGDAVLAAEAVHPEILIDSQAEIISPPEASADADKNGNEDEKLIGNQILDEILDNVTSKPMGVPNETKAGTGEVVGETVMSKN